VKIIFIFLLASFSLLLSVDLINHFIFNSYNNEDIPKFFLQLLRMEIWPYHMIAGIVMSVLMAFYLKIKSTNKYLKILAILNVFIGFSLIYYNIPKTIETLLLVPHIILSLYLFIYIVNNEIKDNFLYGMTSFILSIILTGIFIILFWFIIYTKENIISIYDSYVLISHEEFNSILILSFETIMSLEFIKILTLLLFTLFGLIVLFLDSKKSYKRIVQEENHKA